MPTSYRCSRHDVPIGTVLAGSSGYSHCTSDWSYLRTDQVTGNKNGNKRGVALLFEATRIGGTTIMVGSPPGGSQLKIDGRALFSDRRLLGCTGGQNIPARDIPRIMEFYRQGSLNLEKLVSQRLPLARVNEAFEALKVGKLARSVIDLIE